MKGELTPVSDLSAAFLTPKSGFHLQFAYYQSSLVVEFLVDKFGFEALLGILHDLGDGKSINQAIAARTAPLAQIEKEFEEFAGQRAEQLGAGLEWKRPEQLAAPPSGDPIRRRFGLTAPEDDKWMDQYPKNYWVLQHKAAKLIGQKKWEEAKAPLQTLIENYPDQTGSDSAYLLLAAAHRGLSETNLERQALSKAAVLDADAIDAFLRLMELASASGGWSEVAANAERYLAVNPLVPAPYRFLGLAHEELKHTPKAIQAYNTLLKLDAPDPAGIHFRLAKLQHAAGDSSAKRHVLQTLEEAPRFLEAHRLLLAITQESRADTNRLPEAPAAAPTNPNP